ncbi:hypothetical protein B484DRAFT_454726 [Ochromonadaceae sp. CCMP2298]|nr:hypothetical protein B484DRAFT_454726 [Ochromonadaceae sp. CCMP2298]
MARMKYLHEYCHEFDDELQQVEDDIDSQVEELAEEEYWESGKGFKCIPGESKVYFSGIRSMARSEVCGGRSMLEMKEGMVDRDNAWPEKWPWLE